MVWLLVGFGGWRGEWMGDGMDGVEGSGNGNGRGRGSDVRRKMIYPAAARKLSRIAVNARCLYLSAMYLTESTVRT